MALNINGTTGISGVDGSASAPALQGTDSNTGINFGSDTVNINTGGTTRATVDSAGALDVPSNFPIKVNGSEKLRIDSSGRLGLGSSNPSAGRLVVTSSSDGGFGGSLVLENSNGSDTDKVGIALRPNGSATTAIGSYGESRIISEYNSGSTNGANNLQFHTHTGDGTVVEGFRLDSNGNAFFGEMTSVVASSSNKGVVIEKQSNYGRANFHAKTGAGTVPALGFYHSGGSVGFVNYTVSSVAYTSTSDYRLKENVTAISDAITRLKTLKPSRFNFKVDPDKKVDGFLAHEVTAVPEAIIGTKDKVVTQAMIDAGDYEEGTLNDPIYQAIDQSKLVPLLTAALQEAVAKIEVLETKVAALEAG